MAAAALAYWNTRPVAVRVGLLMVFQGLTVASMNAIIRMMSETVPSFELVFFRNLFGFLVMLPLLRGLTLPELRPRRPGLLALTIAGHLVTMMCTFTALATLPLNEVAALGFATPLFATVGAAIFLRERVGLQRWTATLLGFAGVLIVLRPGFVAFGLDAALVVCATIVFSGVTLLLKQITRVLPSKVLVFYQSAGVTVLSLAPALAVWQTPGPSALAWMVGLGVLGSLGWLTLTRSFALADASAVLPYEFLRLPFNAFLAFVLFAERPDLWTWVGAAVIFASTVYLARAERRRRAT